MRQVVERRFAHFLANDAGFENAPNLLLIDGGINHAATVRVLLDAMGLELNVFGMVKDDRHRTRALVTPDGEEIAIDTQQSVFALIGNIQEETHRFAITYHRKLRTKRLRYSELDEIQGIGPKRKQELLKVFKSLTAIGEATLPELERILPKNAASAVYQHFRNKGNKT
jgi:excinuclease ABC subunit C